MSCVRVSNADVLDLSMQALRPDGQKRSVRVCSNRLRCEAVLLAVV